MPYQYLAHFLICLPLFQIMPNNNTNRASSTCLVDTTMPLTSDSTGAAPRVLLSRRHPHSAGTRTQAQNGVLHLPLLNDYSDTSASTTTASNVHWGSFIASLDALQLQQSRHWSSHAGPEALRSRSEGARPTTMGQMRMGYPQDFTEPLTRMQSLVELLDEVLGMIDADLTDEDHVERPAPDQQHQPTNISRYYSGENTSSRRPTGTTRGTTSARNSAPSDGVPEAENESLHDDAL